MKTKRSNFKTKISWEGILISIWHTEIIIICYKFSTVERIHSNPIHSIKATAANCWHTFLTGCKPRAVYNNALIVQLLAWQLLQITATRLSGEHSRETN